MKNKWGTRLIDPTHLIRIARGDQQRLLKYLKQFQELIPRRTAALRKSLQAGDRKMVRQHVHQMSAQLQFFGIPGIVEPIRRLEDEYEQMPMKEMTAMVTAILKKTDQALTEVASVINHQF